ncbi:MAG: Cna domain protein [Bryobacterales bacterium]|nr:Cna domain protein [Bryobacterales bacterium]
MLRTHARGYLSSFASAIPAIVAGMLIILSTAPAHAQSTSTGTISGQVSDPSGAAIAAAEVKLVDTSTNSIKTALTNESGRYNFFNVSPGLYDVVISRPGFSESKFTRQRVEVGLVLTLNANLQVGAASTVVEVAASAGAELQTANATVGSTISGIQLDSLPNIGRDANAFMLLQPGVAPGGNVGGTITDQNSYQLDGGNNSSDMDGTMAAYTLTSGTITGSTGGTPSGAMPTPIESIEEFKVSTSNQTADFNGSAGGQVQMVTKRGSNQFHGSAYEYLLSSYFSANLWKNDHTPAYGLPYTPLAKTHQNRYGASLGGPMLPNWLGGKTYFFVNYEARRFPQSTTFERQVPSALLKAGVIQLPNSSGVYQAYNINPYPVTVNGTTYQPAVCPAGACDPLSIGLNPVVSKVWSYMPAPNDPQFGDGYNTQGYNSNVSIPQQSDNYVIRLDHDFGQNWHLMTSYRYYTFKQNTTNQTDFGGLLGGTMGQLIATAPRVQKPGFFVTGLTTTISPTLTNDFHYNYLRNYWEWGTDGAPPQIAGLGGAIEIGGETATTNALIPYNVNSQSVRQRFWDGKDQTFRDDMSWVHGNHLFQFGGSYQRNSIIHQRDDNGAGIFNNTVYQIGGATGGINFLPAYIPTNLPSNQIANWNNFYTEVLGIVSQPQTLYTRSGSNLALQPLGTNLDVFVTVPFYNEYFSDTWHMRKDLTLTYGLGYQIEMPPTEKNSQQVLMVDQAGNQISAAAYFATKAKMALQGQTYNPILGFETINNVSGVKYPYKPFYGGFSPRIAVAWNPNFNDGILGKVFGGNKTVIRGGYSRIFGRLNGDAQVLNPVLGAGLLQPVSCIGASKTGQCLGSSGVDSTSAFRIGTDGNSAPLQAVSSTLAQPYFPGVGGNATAGDGTVLDANFRPNRSDVFDLTIQRQISNKFTMEAGYIGRVIRNEFQLVNMDAVPTMYTLNGQTFANAFGTMYQQVAGGQPVTTQPFFESALGGPSSAYCTGYASCTAAVAAKQKTQITGTQVYTLWAQMSNSPSWTLGRTLPSSATAQTASIYQTTSLGWGNYNAAFVSFTMRDWHGLTARSNFTWSRTMGTVGLGQQTSSTTVLNPYDIGQMYGPQPFDIRFVYNLSMIYQPVFFKDNKVLHRILDGWNFAPLFTAQSGAPLEVNISGGGTNNCQSFGESNCSSDSTYENAVLIAKYTGGNSLHENVSSSTSVASSGNPAKGGSGLNLFADPNASFGQFRRLILGVDTTGGGAGTLRNFPTWNLDMAISKDFKIPYREGIGLTFNAQFSNMLNHFQAGTPALNIDSPTTFGVVTTQANTPRQIEFGLRLHW